MSPDDGVAESDAKAAVLAPSLLTRVVSVTLELAASQLSTTELLNDGATQSSTWIWKSVPLLLQASPAAVRKSL